MLLDVQMTRFPGLDQRDGAHCDRLLNSRTGPIQAALYLLENYAPDQHKAGWHKGFKRLAQATSSLGSAIS